MSKFLLSSNSAMVMAILPAVARKKYEDESLIEKDAQWIQDKKTRTSNQDSRKKGNVGKNLKGVVDVGKNPPNPPNGRTFQ